MNLSDLSYWYPILHATCVPTPATEIIRVDDWHSMISLLDGVPSLVAAKLCEDIADAADNRGYPCFLRTGETSHKHGWKNSCFLQREADIPRHVVNLIEFSECADFMGLGYGTWAVREFLNLKTAFTAFEGDFPVNKERRYFVNGGKVFCHHPYWPLDSILDHRYRSVSPEKLAMAEELNREDDAEVAFLTELSEVVSKAFGDKSWSLDWACDVHGTWWAIDMAEAERSFHWPDCPNCPDKQRRRAERRTSEKYLGHRLIPVQTEQS